MAQQADLKATHYTHQLQNALTRGLWADPSPALAVKGEPMTWSELLRKYKKHCVSQHITAEIALQTQSLSLLLLPDPVDAKRITQEDLDGDSEEPHGSMSLGTECELSPSRIDDARLGFAALELLNDTPNERDSTLFTRAYFAYALKRYKECLALLNPMSFDEDVPEPASATKSTRLQVPSEGSTGSTGTHLTWTGSIASVDVDVRDAKMWRLVEIIRGRCLQGMAMEKLGHAEEALSVYEAALPILQSLRLPHTPASQNDAVDPSFIKYRELWRWAERLLWRASCLVSRFAPIDRALTVFRVYSNHAQYYPPTFRPNHRSIVSSLYLYALLLTYPGSEQAIPGVTRLSWITEARTLLGEYRLVLAQSTVFPRAGDRNIKVEEYCDGVMAVWERAGANGKEAQWAIEILWWATRMTFHSHRIFRHLVRLIHANGDNELAKRTMALYAQLVTKSRQASMGEVESTIRRRRTLDNLDNDTVVMGDVETIEDSIGSDSDRQFVECLIFGARMLCRLPGDVEDIKTASNYLASARDIVSQSTSLGTDNVLRARLSCAEGVAELTLAHRDADPITRPVLMRSALNHLGSAVQLNPASPDAYYHLAIALIQAGPTRDVEASVQAAQHAVELDASDIRYWHLLGLVLSASGQHAQARKVLIIGEELELDGDAEGTVEEPTVATTSDSVLGESQSASPTQPETLIPVHQKHCPTPSKMLLPPLDHPQPSKEDLFEHGLQLRMTLLSLIELVDGAEVASVKWVEVFAWFAERGGWAQPNEERRASFDLPPINTIPPSDSGHESNEDDPYPQRTRSASVSDVSTSGLPITVVPPQPKDQGDSDSVHTVRLSSEKDEEQSISRTKKAQRIIKEQVNKRQSQIQTISKKLGRSNTLRSQMSRASSTPDITLLAENSRLYQASSIHSRQRMSPRASYINTSQSPPPRTPPAPALADIVEQRSAREKRLICELWLTSAATFRRMGKLEQAREAVQEAEGLDEGHPGVWVQLGLYFVANGESSKARSAFHKALVINPDYIPAVVHLAQQYLKPVAGQTVPALVSEETESARGMVDLAAGMLSSFTKGPGWDVPEAWYLLANAVSLQGRKERERECLTYALGLIEGKPIRDIRIALDCAL